MVMNDPRVAPVIKDLLAGGHDPHKSDVARGLLPNDQVPFIAEYVKNTHGPEHDAFTVKVEAVFDVERQANEFKGPLTNHKLLFHGTPKENVYLMLRDGFSKAIQPENGAFGKGIYFTDCSSKALGLTHPEARKAPDQADKGKVAPPDGTQYLLVSEVALGKAKEVTQPEPGVAKLLHDETAVFAKGSYRPTERCEIPGSPPVEVPMGALKKCILTKTAFHYNEYVVFKAEQCRHKYLVKVSIHHTDKHPKVFGI